MIEGRIIELIEQKLKEAEWQDCFLVEVKQHGNHKLDVFMDSDDGITFDKCRKMSRYLEEYLDTHLWLGEKYTLEVSSPGISRPLTMKRQYKKNIGRKVEVKLIETGKEEGKLIDVTEDFIVIEQKKRIKEGNKKKAVTLQKEITYDQISKTKVKISFN